MNCKKLSNKGFSLIEILVAVSIIGIISAIAIPGFQNYRKDAATVAGTTSVQNIAASFTNCQVLKTFGECDSMAELGVNCSDCTEKNGTDKLCIELEKTVGGDDFKACFSVDNTASPQEVLRTYGGSLLTGAKVCSVKEGKADGTWKDLAVHPPVKNCTQDSECPTDVSVSPVSASSRDYSCGTPAQNGTCASNACT